MNNRIKLKYPPVVTRAQMETLIREISALKLNEKSLLAEMDARLQTVRDEFEPRLTALAQLLASKTTAAHAWADASPAEFAGRKSVEFIHGAIGFRTGMPKLKILGKANDVLDALHARPDGRNYIRFKEELNKEQLISDFAARILDEHDLQQLGAEVVREESFYIEPRLTAVESRQIAEAA